VSVWSPEVVDALRRSHGVEAEVEPAGTVSTTSQWFCKPTARKQTAHVFSGTNAVRSLCGRASADVCFAIPVETDRFCDYCLRLVEQQRRSR
jgi:hypothetical protein